MEVQRLKKLVAD